ncbi:putative DNA repair protein endonuclease Sae2 [Rosellinia necatrix]|uniref:Putative DNA repair protein endonuclease Sae2 n=1 Tax=Rosellinia necatrix TaxID=77044 RepID=A0A1S7UL57_ROSNE|nr:putative DNA repair protein endonuclease Sae2 [Rosellinia necatrix]
MGTPKNPTPTCGDMENWFDNVGRAILLEAVGDTCDRINNSFRTGFQAHTQANLSLAAELEALRHKASEVRRLEAENIALKDDIRVLREANLIQARAPGTTSHGNGESALRTPLAPKSTNRLGSKRPDQVDIDQLTLPELKAEFLRVDKKHMKLHDKYMDLQSALLQSKGALKDRTTKYHQWVAHAKQLSEQSQKRSRRIKKLEAKLAEVSQEALNSSFSSDGEGVDVAVEPTILTPRPHKPIDLPTPAPTTVPRSPPNAPVLMDGTPISKSPLPARDVPGFLGLEIALEAPQSVQTPNETTPSLPPLSKIREPIREETLIKPEPSSDTPVVVSERCVRKRKHTGGNKDGTPVSAKVKIERIYEPQGTDARRYFAPNESIDFDSEFRRVETPRKHTKYQLTPIVYPDHDVDVGKYGKNTELTRPINTIKRKSRELIGDLSTPSPAANSHTEPHFNTDPSLQSLDNNEVIRPRSIVASCSNRVSSTMPRGLECLAEDGYQDENTNLSNCRNMPRPSILEQLLNTPSSAREDVTLQPDCTSLNDRPTNTYFQLPKRRELPFGKDGRRNGGSASMSSPNVSSHRPASLPTNKNYGKAVAINKTEKGKTNISLRQIPKAELRLDDFKINPHANEGYDYAFTDVVRNKNDRACLQGCVKENCCGHKFRTLAHAYRVGTRPHEFQSLLESYLGDDGHRLPTMSEAEKETLWIEAKMRELANANGKHRHRYPRMSTPPGFWRADFPSTQEGDEYNEEAAKLEKEIIEERYREAMRPGGLWIFRDE